MIIEKAHGRLNVVYDCSKPNTTTERVFTKIGFGATLLPSQFVIKRNSWHEVDEQLVRRNFDKVLISLRAVKSLDIRTHMDDLNLTPISGFKSLRSLRLKVHLANQLDLKDLSQLEMLYGDSPSLQKITGLTELHSLKYVSVPQLRKSWFGALPTSVERLFLRGALDSSINLSALPNLCYLGIANARSIDFKSFNWAATKITRLDLTDVSSLASVETLIELTPNLKTIHFRGDDETYSNLSQSLKGFAEIVRP
jgi:hypothetical protein